MPVIELNRLRSNCICRWLEFLTSQQAERLREAGVLGDWAA